MKRLNKDQLPDFLATLAANNTVFVPAKTGQSSRFVVYKDGLELVLDKNTQLSPKGIFFPQAETMYNFKTKGANLEIGDVAPDDSPKILFGVRSCDVAGIDCLDRVFLQGKYEDLIYKVRREAIRIFALACSTHNDTCFCPSMGLDPQKAEFCDVQMYDCGDYYALDGVSEAGQGFIAHLPEETAPDIKPVEPFAIQVELEGIKEKLDEMFEHPLWEQISTKCIGCRTCSYICPTCYCFDLVNRNKGEDGQRLRCWDSCMADNYTLMAGGHNPRSDKKSRVRNRIMDKLNYNVTRHGRIFCVGCGRCVSRCPVNLDITTIMRQIKEAK